MVLCRIQQDARNSAVSHRRLTLCRVWVADDIASDHPRTIPSIHHDPLWSHEMTCKNLAKHRSDDHPMIQNESRMKSVEICWNLPRTCAQKMPRKSDAPAFHQLIPPCSNMLHLHHPATRWSPDSGIMVDQKRMEKWSKMIKVSGFLCNPQNILISCNYPQFAKLPPFLRNWRCDLWLLHFPGLLTSDCSPDVHDTWVKRAHGSRQLSTCQFESESEKCKNDLP